MITHVDVVIPTLLQNIELIRSCLNSLGKSNSKDISLHIFIACNLEQPSQQTEKGKQLQTLLSELSDLDITWIWMGGNSGFAAAMNKGMAKGKSPLIFCLNDDTTVETNTISELVTTQHHTQSDMIASTIHLKSTTEIDSQGFTFFWRGQAETIAPQKNIKTERSDYWLQYPEFFAQPNQLEPEKISEPFGPDAAACLYTRKMIDHTGGFQDSFFAYLEDVDLALRARMLGMSCSLAEKAIVYHHKHSTSKNWKSFKHQQDLVNWWRICLSSYSANVWLKFGPIILLERGRNLSGYLKSLWR